VAGTEPPDLYDGNGCRKIDAKEVPNLSIIIDDEQKVTNVTLLDVNDVMGRTAHGYVAYT
jgi:hypothetical protein